MTAVQPLEDIRRMTPVSAPREQRAERTEPLDDSNCAAQTAVAVHLVVIMEHLKLQRLESDARKARSRSDTAQIVQRIRRRFFFAAARRRRAAALRRTRLARREVGTIIYTISI